MKARERRGRDKARENLSQRWKEFEKRIAQCERLIRFHRNDEAKEECRRASAALMGVLMFTEKENLRSERILLAMDRYSAVFKVLE